MNSKVQKQFLELGGKPVLYYSLNCFQQSPLITDIILVTGAESVAFCKEEIVEKYGLTKVTKVIPGGKERYDSVYEGLLACENSDFVLIHDGARPFITQEILERGMNGARETGACVIGMPQRIQSRWLMRKDLYRRRRNEILYGLFRLLRFLNTL